MTTSFTPYRRTPKNEPFKPGDSVQFKVTTLAGRGWFLGQIWAKGPKPTASHAPDRHTYWVADGQAYHEVHISDLRLVHTRDHLNETPDVAVVAA